MPPITLTPEQFRATAVGSRPGASYANYRSYIARRRAAPAPRIAPAPVDPMSQILASYRASIQTPAQTLTRSRQAVADEIAASIAANNASIAAQNQQLGNQSQRAQGFALALAKATAPDPEQIKGFYQEAADRLRGYGTGLTGAVAADQAAQTDATKAAVDRVTGGLGSVTSYDPAALRNAAQMASVVIPGSSLESQAANAAAEATYGRAASAGNIGQIAQEYIQKQNDLAQQVAGQNAALQARRPELLRQELASETTQGRQDMATLLSALGLANTQAGTRSLIGTRTAAVTGKQPGTNKPTPTTWLNPVTGAYERIPSGTTIKRVNGKLTPVPTNSKVVTVNGRDKIVPIKPPSGKGSGSAHMQSKTIKGNTVLFDPATGNYYIPGDTKNPINPNTLAPKANLDPEKVRKYRAQATSAVAANVGSQAPAKIYTFGVSKGIPGWIMVRALKAEARKHPGDKVWLSVLAPGWVGGK